MSESPNESPAESPDSSGSDEPDRGLAPHETPEVGLIADEELPDDLQPTDDNPLAKDPDEDAEDQPMPGAPSAEGATGGPAGGGVPPGS